MATSTGKRQNELPLNEQQKDGEVLFKPFGNAEPSSNHPIYPTNEESPQDSKDVESNEASSTDGDLPKGQQNNGNHGTTFDIAIGLILPMQ